MDGPNGQDIRIDEVTTRIQVQDSNAMLLPENLEVIVQAVLARLRQELDLENERREDTTIRNQARRQLE